MQVVPVFRAEGLSHRDAEADTRALDEAQNQKVQRVGAAHSSQCVGAQAAAHDDRIGKAVQLLEHRTQHQRQRKHQNTPKRPPGGQVRGAGGWLFFVHSRGIFLSFFRILALL